MRKICNLCLLPIAVVCLQSQSQQISAQQFSIETFTTKQGLAHDNVRAMAMDSLGFLWLATWDGVSRYDGYTFKNYFHHPNDSLSLPYFSIQQIVTDGGNNLWLFTDDFNIAWYDRVNDEFVPIDRLPYRLIKPLLSISIDETGYLWITKPDTVFRFDYNTKDFEKYTLHDESGKRMIIGDLYLPTVSVIDENRIWIVSGNIWEFTRGDNNILVFKNNYRIDSKNPYRINDFNYQIWYRIYFSPTGNKWIFSNEGLFLLDNKTGVFREFRNPVPYGEFSESKIFIWSWYDDGIYLYNQGKNRLFHIPATQSKLVKAILFQADDLIWFSNFSSTGASMGISKVVFTPEYFKHYINSTFKDDIPAVYSIVKDTIGNIWLGLRGLSGLNSLLKVTPDDKISNLHIPDYPDLEKSGAVRTLILRPDGLWVGFFSDLLLFYDFKTNKFTRFYPDGNYFRPIATDKEGNLYYVGFDGALNILHPDLNNSEKLCDFTPMGPLYKILVTKLNMLWAGSFNSTLVKIDPESRKSETFLLAKDKYNIEDICEGDSGDLWLALLGGGVCNFNPLTRQTRFFTTSNGLSNNITYGVLKDKSGNIWVSTNTGISRINPKSGIIKTFGPGEGLNIVEFNSGATYKSNNGMFYMGGMGGFVEFNPDSINKSEINAGKQKVIITDIGSSGKTVKYRSSLYNSDTIYLGKGKDNLAISFSSSDFIHSGKTVYRYMLSPVNENWVETDSRNRNVNFANLKHGWYTFLIESTDRNGNWSASEELKIRVRPFYYQTALFKIFVVLLALFLISGIITVYIRQLKQRESQKQASLRLQSLRGQMNPHFIFNSLNSINYFISKNDKVSANKYIADFSNLIRSILDNLSRDFITLEKEIDSLRDYLNIEHLRFGDKFDYDLKINNGIDQNVMICPGLIQPFVENAIWHGVRGLRNRKGLIEVCFFLSGSNLKCMVRDNGIGRQKSEKLKNKNDMKISRGIYLAMERIRTLNGLQGTDYQIKISDLFPEKDNKGTSVEIDLPVVKGNI